MLSSNMYMYVTSMWSIKVYPSKNTTWFLCNYERELHAHVLALNLFKSNFNVHVFPLL